MGDWAPVLRSEPLERNHGKIGVLGQDGTVKYPIDISYNMGWQKLAKTYDSLSGHGLMIGNRTNNVVAYQSYSKSCGVCERHSKKMLAQTTNNIPTPDHLCPKNHTGSLKGM
jgi:hypothetical protein